MSTATSDRDRQGSHRDSWPWRRVTVVVGGERYIATVSEGPHNWSAHVARLSGLVMTGPYIAARPDLERIRQRLREGITFHLEGLALAGGQHDGTPLTSSLTGASVRS